MQLTDSVRFNDIGDGQCTYYIVNAIGENDYTDEHIPNPIIYETIDSDICIGGRVIGVLGVWFGGVFGTIEFC